MEIHSTLTAPRLGRALIVGSDVAYRRAALDFLASQGCSGRGVDHTADIPAMIRHGVWGFIVVDIGHSYVGGLEQVRQIRTHSLVPILVTGSTRCSFNRAVAYELGADGYIAKTSDLHELWALARAVARCHEIGIRLSTCGQERGGYRFAGWVCMRGARSLASPSGEDIALTRTSYALLSTFLDAPRRILSRAHLLHSTRTHEDILDRSIDVQILRLREALRRGDPSRQFIRTERNRGYAFDSDVERLL